MAKLGSEPWSMHDCTDACRNVRANHSFADVLNFK